MLIDIITLFPGMFDAVSQYGVTGRALSRNQIQHRCWDLRQFSDSDSKRVDDKPYGGGPGMVLRPEPLTRAVEAVRQSRMDAAPVIYLSPQGRQLDQAAIRQLASGAGFILIAGRYEGVDERWIELQVDQQWSIGPYVLSGGELPAMVLMDAVIRLVPGVLGNEQSPLEDSFNSEQMLEWPQYTRPRSFRGMEVPPVLLQGNHGEIDRWRTEQALKRSKQSDDSKG